MRVEVRFYPVTDNRRAQPLMRWFDAAGHIPLPQDFVIDPKGGRWRVVTRTWDQAASFGG